MKKSYLAVAAVAAVIGLPAVSLAAEGAVVVRDAETGQLRAPTAAESAALRKSRPGAAVAAAAKAAPVQRKLAHGAVMAVLPEEMMQFSVVSLAADGSLVRSCVQGADQAEKVATQPQFAKPLSMSTARTARGMAYEVR
jgi:hypothetical protein